MSLRIRELWHALAPEPNERTVLSVVFERADHGLVLRCASLLLGPPAITEGGWPTWRLAEGHKPTPGEPAISAPGTFFVQIDGAAAGRVALSQEDAFGWARATLEEGTSPAVGPLPPARAALTSARAPIRVTTHAESIAGDLAVGLARPIAGFHFPRADDPAELGPSLFRMGLGASVRSLGRCEMSSCFKRRWG